MTHKMPANFASSLPINKPLSYQPIKLYSLFKKDANGWTRISDASYSETLAYRVFAQRLLVNPINQSIRPIKVESLEAK